MVSFAGGATYGNDSNPNLFPSYLQGHNWFFEMIHDCTTGNSAHAVHVVRESTNLYTKFKEFSNLSWHQMKKKVEKTLPDPSLGTSAVNMTSKGVAELCALLIAGVWKYLILERQTVNKDSHIFADRIYVLILFVVFGFIM